MIENLPGHQKEPFSLDTPSIIPRLVDESNLNFAFDLSGSSIHQLIVGTLEKMSPINLDMNPSTIPLLSQLRMISEDELFGLEIN